MDWQGDIIRPPSEADSLLLQVSLGCPHNACRFCGAYLAKPFRLKDPATVAEDIEWAARHRPGVRRLFLMDGDCLALPQGRLLEILRQVREGLPHVTRVASYGSARSLARKSDAELAELREAGLGLLYMGLESGSDEVLARMTKGVDVAGQIAQARRARAAGFKLNLTVIVGLAGAEGSLEHARATGAALTAIDPEQVGALTLMLVPGTPLYDDWCAGRFVLPDAQGMLAELRELLAHTRLSRGLFLANHASNHLPLRLRLPRDREAGLAALDAALAGRARLVPEAMRRL